MISRFGEWLIGFLSTSLIFLWSIEWSVSALVLVSFGIQIVFGVGWGRWKVLGFSRIGEFLHSVWVDLGSYSYDVLSSQVVAGLCFFDFIFFGGYDLLYRKMSIGFPLTFLILIGVSYHYLSFLFRVWGVAPWHLSNYFLSLYWLSSSEDRGGWWCIDFTLIPNDENSNSTDDDVSDNSLLIANFNAERSDTSSSNASTEANTSPDGITNALVLYKGTEEVLPEGDGSSVGTGDSVGESSDPVEPVEVVNDVCVSGSVVLYKYPWLSDAEYCILLEGIMLLTVYTSISNYKWVHSLMNGVGNSKGGIVPVDYLASVLADVDGGNFLEVLRLKGVVVSYGDLDKSGNKISMIGKQESSIYASLQECMVKLAILLNSKWSDGVLFDSSGAGHGFDIPLIRVIVCFSYLRILRSHISINCSSKNIGIISHMVLEGDVVKWWCDSVGSNNFSLVCDLLGFLSYNELIVSVKSKADWEKSMEWLLSELNGSGLVGVSHIFVYDNIEFMSYDNVDEQEYLIMRQLNWTLLLWLNSSNGN